MPGESGHASRILERSGPESGDKPLATFRDQDSDNETHSQGTPFNCGTTRTRGTTGEDSQTTESTVRGRRDDEPHRRGQAIRDGAQGHARRRAGPQAVAMDSDHRGGESPVVHRRTPQNGRRRGSEPLPPRTILMAVAGALIIIVIIVGAVRLIGGSSPEAAPSATSVPALAASPTPAGSVAEPTQGPVQYSVQPIEPGYTVQAGDTLASIARRFNTTVDALVSINNIADRNSLRVGQRLVIP